MYTTDQLIVAFSLTLLAGLSTGIGSILAFWVKRANTRFLSVSLGFSAGVMIYVSFAEILVKANGVLGEVWGGKTGAWLTAVSFFGGIAVIALIDRFIPSDENPHEVKRFEDVERALQPLPRDAGTVVLESRAVEERVEAGAPAPAGGAPDPRALHRTGLFTALAIGIHNFPEGLATFTAALENPALGIAIAVAIAIHNIPEGIAVSVPIYYATGDRKKAFVYSFLSGLAEPVGALVGFLILLPFFTPTVFGVLFAGVAGIMVFISLDELLPTAERYGEHHLCIYGLVSGMAVMAVSLLLFL